MVSSKQDYGDPETRRKILDAAWELIKERGASIRISEVAERAGISRQSVYLHFGDRSGLILGLVHYMDEKIGLKESLAHIFSASTGTESMQRLMNLHRTFNPKIDPVERVLESTQYEDKDLGGAWRERLEFRRSHHRQIIKRIEEEGCLPEGWTAEEAGDLFFAITLPAVWRELSRNLGWTKKRAAEAMALLVRRAFVDE